LQENERVTNIASSILDEKWVNMITSKADNYLIIIEGLTMYLTKDDIKTLLGIISTHFHHVTIFMETMNPFVVKRIKEKSIEKTHSKFTWGIKTGKELEKYNSSFTFIKDDYLTTGMKQIYPIYHFIEKIKFIRNISNKITILQSHEERKEK
jgi:O-methyltransferase involved in polyketide biosynthesis